MSIGYALGLAGRGRMARAGVRLYSTQGQPVRRLVGAALAEEKPFVAKIGGKRPAV